MNWVSLLNRISKLRFTLPIPVFGMGCGVLGLTIAKQSIHIGKYASTLLRALEYRGYDSTGACFQTEQGNITLLKDVGAPSVLVKSLGIEKQEGIIFCGQVRWATFGTVNKVNAQPHEVQCKRHIYGAHNGNITNTRELKAFLISEGHTVLSDNDGEMLVHTVEHYFNIELDKQPEHMQNDPTTRRQCMREAIQLASDKMVGSYAAVIVDPITEVSYAIKAGSSLYFGVGNIDGNAFGLASSDLTAVLRFTKMLVKLREGEFIEYTPNSYQIYAHKDLRFKHLGQPDEVYCKRDQIEAKAIYSKLRAEDTELMPEFSYYMEQEIYAEPESTGKLIKLFQGGSNTGKHMRSLLEKEGLSDEFHHLALSVNAEEEYAKKLAIFDDYANSENANHFYTIVQQDYTSIFNELVKENFEKKYFFSSEKNTFVDLMGTDFDKKRMLLSKALDAIVESWDVHEFNEHIDMFLQLLKTTMVNCRNTYTVACGTSYHATKVAAMFFNEIAGFEIIPILPGDFRGEYSNSIKEHDLIIGVSQSGETKDLIDIFNDIDNMQLDVKKAVLVNNMNSTLGTEKSDVAIPILCGPEIAVPATKSFMNQLTLFYYLAIKTLEMKLNHLKENGGSTEQITTMEALLDKRYNSLNDIPLLLKETLNTTKDSIEQMASMIYMEPSMHILATKISGVALEGALKVRETVLNHTEGKEASEFKHGPNTLLGKNTVFGMKNIKSMFAEYDKLMITLEIKAKEQQISSEEHHQIVAATSHYIFNRTYPFNLSKKAASLFKELVVPHDFFNSLYRNYPLLYVTGPDERDVNLTISQINTHKIRGADTFIIAEENDKLMRNASLAPTQDDYYGWSYIMLPKTGDCLMTAFSSTIVLQLLALKMSIKKMTYLDKLNIAEHGVHPDVPKNVSKSITVD